MTQNTLERPVCGYAEHVGLNAAANILAVWNGKTALRGYPDSCKIKLQVASYDFTYCLPGNIVFVIIPSVSILPVLLGVSLADSTNSWSCSRRSMARKSWILLYTTLL